MSFRELRNFIEHLRTLGYPRLVSLENFRTPNFRLVAEILQWLISRFDPSIELPKDIDTEQDRVIFIKTATQIMATTGQIKLNTKKLYLADGHAVQELLKITSILYEAATQTDVQNGDEQENSENLLSDAAIASKINELKQSRQLVSEITQRGANLYDLLAQEIELREQRAAALAKKLEIPEIERSIKSGIKEIQSEIEKINYKIDNVSADESSLDVKIDKKKTELERNQKRLQTLKSVRPAFMDEYEKLEEELKYVYELYVTRFRCLTFLQQQLEEIEEAEAEKMQQRDEQIKRIVEQMQQEELLRNENETGSMDDLIDEDDDEITDEIGVKDSRMETSKSRRSMINTTTVGKRTATGKIRVFGSLMDGEKNDSLDSDLDLDGDEEASDLDSEDELELMNLTSSGNNRKNKANEVKKSGNDSDNDF